MKIGQAARIARPVDDVWNILGDIPLVVGCIPGAELGEKLADNRYRGTFRLKVGPLTAKIDGEGEVTRDAAAKTGRITGRGIDKRGGSRVGASVDYKVANDNGGSLLTVNADLDLSGPLAQVGRTGIIEDVAKRLTEEFTAALEQKLNASGPETANKAADTSAPAKEFDVGSALADSLILRIVAFIKRLLGKTAQ
jgi:carbon monoxide dehydrogenase subunit G